MKRAIFLEGTVDVDSIVRKETMAADPFDPRSPAAMKAEATLAALLSADDVEPMARERCHTWPKRVVMEEDQQHAPSSGGPPHMDQIKEEQMDENGSINHESRQRSFVRRVTTRVSRSGSTTT